MPVMEAAECFACRKHRERGVLVPGGFGGEDELVVVSHMTPWPPGVADRPAYLGYLFVEPRRHAPGLADLTEAEARSAGWWCTRASRALREVAGAEHVYAKVIGDGDDEQAAGAGHVAERIAQVAAERGLAIRPDRDQPVARPSKAPSPCQAAASVSGSASSAPAAPPTGAAAGCLYV